MEIETNYPCFFFVRIYIYIFFSNVLHTYHTIYPVARGAELIGGGKASCLFSWILLLL